MTSFAYLMLWIFVFSVPWENAILITGVGAISRLAGMVAVGFALLATMISGRFRRWHPMHIAALLFLAWAGATQLFFVVDRLSLKFYTYVQLVLVMWIVWELAWTRRRVIGLLIAYIAGAYVAAINTLIVYRRTAASTTRFATEGFDPNDSAMIFALTLPMAWYLATVDHRPLLRWICRAYVPLGLIGIALTGSRGGMLAGVVALAIVPLMMTKLSPARLAVTMIVIAASGVVAVKYVPQTTIERLASTKTEIQDRSLNGRWKLWKAGLDAFAQRPLTGHGSGSFKVVVSRWLGESAMVAHNSYLSVLTEQGIIGFVLFAWMFIAVFLAVLELPVLDRRFSLVLMATLAIAMLPLSWEDKKSVWCILAIVLGIAKSVPDAGSILYPERGPGPHTRVAAGGPRPVAPFRSAPRGQRS